MARGKKASVIIRKERGKPVLASPWDAECFDKFQDGTEFDLEPRKQRSLPQNRLYWQILQGVVEATDLWATKEHLHDALLRDLGYISVSFDMTRHPYVTRDSAAFDAMNAQEFGEYMTKAMARLAEAVGFDPAEVLSERAAA
jgi:hypothetical protein